MIKLFAAGIVLALSSATSAAFSNRDPTEVALEACLAAPSGASTGGQTDCETKARSSYDKRMNVAYAALLHRLPVAAAARLRAAQRAWLTFRSGDDAARAALYETRQGTMYVPMQAAAATDIVRDRALQLETSLQVMTIDD